MRYSIFASGVCAAFLTFGADISVMEEIVCKVNGDIITRSELEKDRKQAESELRAQGLTGARLTEAVNNATRHLLRERIDRLLLVQKGKELDLKVDAEVTKQIAEIQSRSGISDQYKFQQFVREQNRQPHEDYRDEMKNGRLTKRVIRQEVSSKIQFSR